jgi:hypothetical protein
MNYGLTNEDLYMEFHVKRKSGRTWIITSDGSDPVFEKVKIDNTILKALIKAHLWKRELRRGKYGSIRDLAEKKSVNEAYVRRVLNLNYLSPKIKEMILDGKQPKHLRLQDLLHNAPLLWGEQEKLFIL